jgi:hypothetical protein
MSSRKDEIRQLIINHNRRLQKLREQQALQGLGTAPETLIEIENIETQKEQLELELETLDNSDEYVRFDSDSTGSEGDTALLLGGQSEPRPLTKSIWERSGWVWAAVGAIATVISTIVAIIGIYFVYSQNTPVINATETVVAEMSATAAANATATAVAAEEGIRIAYSATETVVAEMSATAAANATAVAVASTKATKVADNSTETAVAIESTKASINATETAMVAESTKVSSNSTIVAMVSANGTATTEAVINLTSTTIAEMTAKAVSSDEEIEFKPLHLQAVVIAENQVRLFDGPGTVYPLIQYLNKGDKLRVLERVANNKWVKATLDNPGAAGWVRTNLIQISGPLESIPVVVPPLPVKPVYPPIHLKPEANSSHYLRIDLEWEWEGTLGPNDYFQIEIRNRSYAYDPIIDENVPPIDVAWVKDTYYRYDDIEEAYDREYTWRVMVVRGIPIGEKQWSTLNAQVVWEPNAQFQQISHPSEMWTFYVEPGPTPLPEDKKPTRSNFRP